jgi:DNA-binding NarL/FixJ family response regulator
MIRILLVDDQRLMLEGIKAILAVEPEIEVVGTAKNGKDAIKQTKNLQPDIVLIDIEMPQMDGITATQYICRNISNTKVLILSSYESREYVIKALKAGAWGYLLKDSLTKDLKQAIYSVYKNYSYMEARFLTQIVSNYPSDSLSNSGKDEKLKKILTDSELVCDQINHFSTEIRKNIKDDQNRLALGISKATLAPIFDLPQEDILKDSYSQSKSQITYTQKTYAKLWKSLEKRRLFKKLLVLILVAISMILSIIIF